MFGRPRDQSGFTLVEVVASLMVFSVITVGVVPLLASAMRGTAITRSYTLGKNLAQEAMERVRGLPYYISYAAQAQPVDVLDLYYPTYVSAHPFAYVTTCSSGTTTVRACPKTLPDPYTMEFAATFVEPQVSGTTETFDAIATPSTYTWNNATSDAPVSNLMRIVITTRWLYQGRERSFTVESIIGDRKFEALKVVGRAKVDYGVSIVTQFTDTLSGAQSALSATDGRAESSIESRITSSANQTVEAGLLTVTEVPDDATVVAENIDTYAGARAVFRAPPNVTPATTTVAAGTVTNTSLNPAIDVAGVDANEASDLSASVSAELPIATGAFRYPAENFQRDVWATQQLDTTNAAALLLDITRPMIRIQPKSSSGNAIFGKTEGQTTDGAAAGVLTRATYTFRDFSILPTTFIDVLSVNENRDRSVVVIDSFTATAECNSKGTSSSTASATWNATLKHYSADIADYRSYSLTQANAATELANLRSTNPLVFDGATAADDIYLFEERDAATNAVTKRGYLVALSAGSVASNVSADFETTTASIEGALRIDTVTLNPSVPGSTINVNIGRMRCEAVDRR